MRKIYYFLYRILAGTSQKLESVSQKCLDLSEPPPLPFSFSRQVLDVGVKGDDHVVMVKVSKHEAELLSVALQGTKTAVVVTGTFYLQSKLTHATEEAIKSLVYTFGKINFFKGASDAKQNP